jgi:sterol desaturase/sphingolipid hydroxylase (fatty acid hydroxylase superfamily)
MEDVMAEADWGTRDTRGEWRPEVLPKPGVLFDWPPRPAAIARYLFAPEGFLWPYNLLVFLIALASWLWLTPGEARTAHLTFGWIGLLWLRNAALLLIVYGGVHLWLYVARAQGTRFKYTSRWLATDDRKFLFRHQLWDNVFWTLVSGCTFWTAYEGLTLWAYANHIIPRVEWGAHPIWCTLLVALVVLFRLFHFYWAHRLIHWKPLYGPIHSLHHKNVNVGPWSGLAMHPLEHLVYFSCVLIHWVVPSHPVHAMFNLAHAALTPVLSHVGFHKLVGRGERGLMNDNYFHYLHHRYFTVNFGGEAVPLDQWFGTFHDGSPEAHARMARREKLRAVA